MTQWILVADRSRARIFEPNAPQFDRLNEVADFEHPESRLRRHDVVSDQQGRFAETAGGQHAGQPETDYKHETAAAFAAEIVKYLEEGRQTNRFSELTVIAAPLFLGVLRNKFPAPLSHIVKREIDKDYTTMKPADILKRIGGIP